MSTLARNSLTRLVLARLALAITPLFLLPGCASTDALTEQLAQHEQRLSSIELSLRQAALAAQQAKDLAGDALARAQGLETRMAQQEGRQAGLADQLQGQGQRLNQVSNVAGQSDPRIEGTLLETLTLTGDKSMYPLNSVELDGRDCAQLDQLVARLKTLGHPYYLEIQGHTDDSGYGEYNYLLGEARANAVSRYLHTQGGVPLHRMSVISYGAAQALAGSQRGDSEKSSRRVVVLVLK